MKTAEEKAKEYADSILPAYVPETIVENTVLDLNKFAQTDFLAGYSEATRWMDPKEELPPLLPNHDYSAPVLTKVKDCNDLQVMCLLFVPGDDEDDDEDGGRKYSYMWGNCYGDINGDPYLDDNYDVIAWRPIE